MSNIICSTMHSRYRFVFQGLLATIVCVSPVLAQQANPMQTVGTSSTLPLGGNAQPGRSNPSLAQGPLSAVPEDFSDLRLAPGFLLNVEVYDEPELSTQARVDHDGNIVLPLIGSVHLTGKTVAEAEKIIQDKYRAAQILKNPQVTLNVEQYASASVTVLGEVQAPGRIQLLGPHSLPEVLGMAGGETNLAGDTIQVETPGKDGPTYQTYHYARGKDGNELREVMIKPGDTITVKRAGIVYVLGAVNRPGGYVMQEDGTLNVAQALSLALGTSLQAKIGSVRVVRHSPDGKLTAIPISYKGIMDGKVKPMQLQAEDIVYVPVSKIKTVFTTGATMIGEAGAATIYTAP